MLKKALDVAAAKAKVAGLVVAAAALGGTAVAAGPTAFVPTAGEDTVTATPTASPSPEPTVTPPTTGTSTTTTTEATRTPLPCPSDVANHGAYVSQVAHDKTVKGREHGEAVSEAAHSDCGKPAADATETATENETADSEAPEVEATEAPEQDDADESDDADDKGTDTHKAGKQGHGKSHG